MERVRRGVLVTAGLLSVALGVAGIFLPLLPTTPFLLLAAACFVRSSERLYRWLLEHRWLGPYLRNYREHRALPLRAKVVTLLLLWASVAWGTFAVLEHWALRVPMLLVSAGVTVFVLRLKTLPRDVPAGGR